MMNSYVVNRIIKISLYLSLRSVSFCLVEFGDYGISIIINLLNINII